MAVEPFQSLDVPDPADKVGDHPSQFAAMFSPGLVGRTVMRFATATDRDSAIPSGSRVSGMVAWLSTPKRLTVWTGSVWEVVAGRVGGRATRASTLTLGSTNSFNLVTFTAAAEESDTGSWTLGSGTFTVPAGLGGVWAVRFSGALTTSAAARSALQVNGTQFAIEEGSAAGDLTVDHPCLALAAGDVVRAMVYVGGSSLTLASADLTIRKVGL